MKFIKRILISSSFFCIIFFLSSKLLAQDIKLTETLQNDVSYLLEKYQNIVPEPMRGSKKEEWNKSINNLRRKVDSCNNYIDYIYALRYFSPIINDAHGSFPDGGIYNRNRIFEKTDTIFPLWVKNWHDGRTFVVKDYTGQIPPLSEIVSINGISAMYLSLCVKNLHPAEDEYTFPFLNEQEQGDFRNWQNLSNHLFMEKINPPYRIEYINHSEKTNQIVTLHGRQRGDMYKEYKKSGDKRKVEKNKGLKKIPVTHNHVNDSISVLTINVFYGKNPLNLMFSQRDNRFERLLKNSMKAIHKNGSKHLIIDLRGNPGGYVGDVFHTMNYLTTDTLYKYSWFKVSKESKERATRVLKNTYKLLYGKTEIEKQEESIRIFTEMDNGSLFRFDTLLSSVYVPDSKLKYRFDGNVYILTNSLSYSGSVLFCGLIKQSNRGVIVGKSPGGYINQRGGMSVQVRSNYWSIIRMKTPYSVSSTLPDLKLGEKYLGVDYEINISLEDWLTNNNSIINELISLINTGVAVKSPK